MNIITLVGEKKQVKNKLNKDLEEIFQTLHEQLDGMDQIREKILPLQRISVRICSEIIKSIHRKEFSSIPSKMIKIKEHLRDLHETVNNMSGAFSKDYLQIVKQELGEAMILYYLITQNRFPSLDECEIGPIDYAYALTDVVGELRRYVLNCIRKEDLENALKGLEYMDEIYSQLFTLDYPNGLVPGLRKKIDAARNILAKTEGDVTVSINILKLNSNLSRETKKE